MTSISPKRVRFGPFEADLLTREVWRNGIRLKLGGQPFEILIALLEKPGQLVSRQELRKRIWADHTFVDFSHGLNAAVNKLREALCDAPEKPRYIETLPRRGYRFIGAVEEAATEAAAEVKEIKAPQVSIESIEVTHEGLSSAPTPPAQTEPWNRSLGKEGWQSSIPVKRETLVHLLALVAPVVLLAVGLTGFYWARWTTGPSPEQIERFEKQGAESARRDIELRGKLQAEKDSDGSVSYARKSTLPPAAPRSTNPEHALVGLKPSPSEESFLLRMTTRTGTRLPLPETSTDNKPAILRVDMRRNVPHTVSRVIGGWEAIGGPQPSPDGKKLAFSAGRTDDGEIWVCNIDGSAPKMLSNLTSAGTPRWSPDGRWIAFDSDGRYGHSGIYVVSVDGGPVHAILQNEANNSVPSWSRDGKYIYFASNRGSRWEGDQLWKVPFSGGEAVQITHHGGFSAYESPDGQILYYAKTRYQNPEIWQVPVNGGEETRVALLHPSTWASWAVTMKGILMLSEYQSSASQLEFFDFSTRSIHSLATLEKASFWLAASADGSSVWYSELTDLQARQVFTASMD
jgi:DNA-binding winged helix-turn-helix (wHTH) protein